MRWQKALTKKQLAHMRWSVNGDNPTLTRFRQLREFQRNLEQEAEDKGMTMFACHDCRAIEFRLREKGVKL